MRGQKLKQDIVTNLVFSVLKALALMWALRLASLTFSPVVLGLFLLIRRLGSTGANLLQCGVSQTLLRYVSIYTNKPEAKRSYVSFATVFWLVSIIVVLLALYPLRGMIGSYLYPDAPIENSGLAFWTGVLALASVGDFIARSPLIAERWLVRANLVELMTGSILIGLPLMWAGQGATLLGTLQFQSLATIFLAGGVLTLYLHWIHQQIASVRWVWADIGKTFLAYGPPRGLVTSLDAGLLLIGPWLLRNNVEQAGFLILALTMVRLIQMSVAPISQVGSVVTARLVGQDNQELIREGVRFALGMIVYTSTILMALIVPWAQLLMKLWLSDSKVVLAVLPYFGVIAWGILPYSIFQGLKGVVEVSWTQPYNLYTLLLASGLQIAVFLLLERAVGPAMAAAMALLVGFWSLGGMTLLWLKAYLRPLNYLQGGTLVVWAGLIAFVNYTMATVTDNIVGFAIALLASVGLIACFFFVFPTRFLRTCRIFLFPARISSDAQSAKSSN